MTTFELAGRALMQAHDGNLGLAHAFAGLFRRRADSKPIHASFTGATFLDQEPDLVAEAHRLPEHMRAI